MRVERLDHLRLTVRDLDATCAFAVRKPRLSQCSPRPARPTSAL